MQFLNYIRQKYSKTTVAIHIEHPGLMVTFQELYGRH